MCGLGGAGEGRALWAGSHCAWRAPAILPPHPLTAAALHLPLVLLQYGMIEAISHLIHRDYEAIVEDFVTLQVQSRRQERAGSSPERRREGDSLAAASVALSAARLEHTAPRSPDPVLPASWPLPSTVNCSSSPRAPTSSPSCPPWPTCLTRRSRAAAPRCARSPCSHSLCASPNEHLGKP